MVACPFRFILRTILVDFFLASLDFVPGLTTVCSYFVRAAQFEQGVHGRFDDIMRIGSPQGLREHILNSRRLDHRADSPARNHARAFRRRLEQHLAGAVTTEHGMRYRSAGDVHLHQVLLGRLDALADRHGHFPGFPGAIADVPACVPHHDQGRKAHVLAALHDLGDTVDRHHLVLQLQRVRINAARHPTSQGSFRTGARPRAPHRPELSPGHGRRNRRGRTRRERYPTPSRAWPAPVPRFWLRRRWPRFSGSATLPYREKKPRRAYGRGCRPRAAHRYGSWTEKRSDAAPECRREPAGGFAHESGDASSLWRAVSAYQLWSVVRCQCPLLSVVSSQLSSFVDLLLVVATDRRQLRTKGN